MADTPVLPCPKCGSTNTIVVGNGGGYKIKTCRPCRYAKLIDWRHRVRTEALEAYGGRCQCCGEQEPAFLTFDHIDGGGNAHRKAEKINGGNGMAVWLKRNGWPAGFQILCFNCNIAKHLVGQCPHTIEGGTP